MSFALYCSVIPGSGFSKRHLSSRDMIKPTEAENNGDNGITAGFKKSEHNLKELGGGWFVSKKEKKNCKTLEKQNEKKIKPKSLLALRHRLNTEILLRERPLRSTLLRCAGTSGPPCGQA